MHKAASYVWHELDDAKDYVYSAWDESQLHAWIVEHHVLPAPAPTGKAALLAAVSKAYTSTTGAVYESWSDSTLREWLAEHGVVPPSNKREDLLKTIKDAYYDTKDKVYTAWDDATKRNWLVDNGILKKSAPELHSDKYTKLLDEHYTHAKSTVWQAWKDSDIRQWLVDNGYVKSDYQAKRDEASRPDRAPDTTPNSPPSSSTKSQPSTRLTSGSRTSRGLTPDCARTSAPKGSTTRSTSAARACSRK